MTNMNNMDMNELEQVAGGKSSTSKGWRKATVKGCVHYLALRTEPAYDDKNETGIKFHNGDTIQVDPGTVRNGYIWARKKSGAKEGWVNKTKVSY